MLRFFNPFKKYSGLKEKFVFSHKYRQLVLLLANRKTIVSCTACQGLIHYIKKKYMFSIVSWRSRRFWFKLERNKIGLKCYNKKLWSKRVSLKDQATQQTKENVTENANKCWHRIYGSLATYCKILSLFLINWTL